MSKETGEFKDELIRAILLFGAGSDYISTINAINEGDDFIDVLKKQNADFGNEERIYLISRNAQIVNKDTDVSYELMQIINACIDPDDGGIDISKIHKSILNEFLIVKKS